MEVKNIGHQDSVTMGTYDIEEIEKSNENKVEIIWKQSQQIEKLKDKLQKQAEWIENNKNKAKNCAMQMQNQGKEIQRLKQSNKDLMSVIWKTKRERANKGREVCKANNEIVQYKKRIAELEEQLEEKEKKIRQLDNEKGMLLNNSMKLLKEKDDRLQSQPAEIVAKIKEFVDGNAYYYEEEQYAKHIIKYLDDILKEYQK